MTMIIQNINENIYSSLLIWLVFLLSILLSWLYQNEFLIRNKIINEMFNSKTMFGELLWTAIIVIGPALLIGFRGLEVGADTHNYVYRFHKDAATFDIFGKGPLFLFFRFIVFHIFNKNSTVFLFLMAFCSLFILVRGLDNWSEKISLPFALFIYYSTLGMQLFNQSRQMMAVSVIIYAIIYIFKEDYIKYIFLVFLASLIHFTALIALVFPLLAYSKKTHYRIKNYLFIIILILTPIILPFILRYISGFLPDIYQNYLISLEKPRVGFGLLLNSLPIIVPILFFLRDETDYTLDSFVRIMLLTIPIRYAGYYSYFLMRLMYYPMIVSILYVPLQLQNKQKNKTQFLILLISFYTLYYFIIYIYLNDSGILPYQLIF